MASFVVNIDIKALNQEIVAPPRYDAAYIVVRFQGRPIGRVWLPLEHGRVSTLRLQRAVTEELGQPLWDACLEHFLGPLANPPSHPVFPTSTVAICTRNRADDLKRALTGLLQLSDDGQEFLVVDNCPSDDSTRELVSQYSGVRYVREEMPGLNIARNRALREARNDLIVFCDDDTVPEPGWLRALLKNFDDKRVACSNGLTLPFELETRAQEWFERYSPFQRGFQRKVFDLNQIHPLEAWRSGAGASMALRRSALARVGLFDPALDAGTLTHSGGDTDMFARILDAGYQIVYDPGAVNWHRHRDSWDALRKVLYGYGVGVYAMWTRWLINNREPLVIIFALNWLFQSQLPGLARSLLRRPASVPLDLRVAELRGCMAGPLAYARSRWQARRYGLSALHQGSDKRS
jgi:GT2 family glycosyltransferase